VHVSTCPVKRVLLTATSPAGDRFVVLLCADNILRITRNDLLIRELSWSVDDVEDCIAQLLELSHLAAPLVGR